MKHLAALLLLLATSAAFGQTVKTLGFNTTNGHVVYAGTNALTFTNGLGFSTNAAAATRTNLGLGWSALTNTNAENFYTSTLTTYSFISAAILDDAVGVRGDIGLGEGDSVRFGGITNDGNITINQWNATNGLLFIYRTNNEPFLGLANLVASNNTTLSNETLFRVGIAEATNKSAQFGFRTVRTNNGGEGFAVFSVFGYSALMMIGPSDRSRSNSITNTNAGIEADIWTITPTNRVMTLRDTNSGAVTLHQELGFSTNNITTNAPANTTNVALWLRVWVGTNNYRLPLYQ